VLVVWMWEIIWLTSVVLLPLKIGPISKMGPI
jgi:hypothetical protein